MGRNLMRTLENQKIYLLIKLFCNTGIRVRKLPDVTSAER